jgi:tetratricopeptide (TPR) repeat protein
VEVTFDIAGIEPDGVLAAIAVRYEHARHFSRAAEYWQAAQRVDPTNGEYPYRLGKLYLECAEYEKAVTHLLSALQLLPNHVATRYLLAKSLALSKDYEQALFECEAALKIQETHPGAINLKLRILVLLGRFEDALAWNASAAARWILVSTESQRFMQQQRSASKSKK